MDYEDLIKIRSAFRIYGPKAGMFECSKGHKNIKLAEVKVRHANFSESHLFLCDECISEILNECYIFPSEESNELS